MRNLIKIAMGGIVLLALLSSCTQYDYSDLYWWHDQSQNEDGNESHTHEYEIAGYEISGNTLYAIKSCECGDSSKSAIRNAIFIDTEEEAEATEIPSGSFVVVTPESALPVLDAVPDGVTVIFSKDTYEDTITFRQSRTRSKVKVFGDLNDIPLKDNIVSAEFYLGYVNADSALYDYGIWAYRRINDVTLYAEEGASFPGGVSIDIDNDYDNIRERQSPSAENYTSIIYVENLTIWNFDFEGSTLRLNIDHQNLEDYGIHGLTVRGCNFIGTDTTMTTNNETGYAINAGRMKTSGCLEDVVIENCSFSKYFKGMNTGTMNNLTVRDSIFTDMGWSSIGIQGQNNSGEFLFSGNEFNGFDECAIGRAKFTDADITVENNTFSGSNPSSSSGRVILWFGNGGTEPLTNVTIRLSNNTYDGILLTEEGITDESQDMFQVFAP